MTATLSFDVRRRAPLGREELRRQLLALVLAFVLVWYTFVVPAGAGARSPRRFEPDDEGNDGEVRGVNRVRGAGGAATPAKTDARADGDDLDWPEYIYP
ncbi:MAG TPA: hypothetical protein VF588_19970 [Pyrinomonadaceae bacterium]|jgi:hypothetical protein